jgi:hypothetical protein
MGNRGGRVTLSPIDQIWIGDLLGRKEEASALIGYIESVAERPRLSPGEHAHVLAIDAGYGEGKTFFLKRLAEQLALSHPVAYVDAWRDDLEDQPLTAIATTLEDALDQYVAKSDKLKAYVTQLRSRAGEVVKIAAGGVVRRLIGLAITQIAADELTGLLKPAKDSSDFINKAAEKTGEDIADKEIEALGAAELMDKRIARFREGRRAIENLKLALTNVVHTLSEADISPPIVVIIDELDRCRPTYAIKLLEEVKHLFDAPGVIFVLGVHARQLTHSIAAAYGSNFAAADYLRRFIHRRYNLKAASLSPLVDNACRDLDIDVARLDWLITLEQPDSRALSQAPSAVIDNYFRSFGVTPRDAFRVLEMLQLSLALTREGKLDLALLLPLIIGRVLASDNPVPFMAVTYYARTFDERTNKFDWIPLENLANVLLENAKLSRDENLKRVNEKDFYAERIIENRNQAGGERLADPRNYVELIDTVGRFHA